MRKCLAVITDQLFKAYIHIHLCYTNLQSLSYREDGSFRQNEQSKYFWEKESLSVLYTLWQNAKFPNVSAVVAYCYNRVLHTT